MLIHPRTRPGKCSLSVFILCLLATAGCGSSGPEVYGVSGTVTYQNEPVPHGLILFIPEGARSAAGGSPIVDGAYEVPESPGLPPGKYKVSISVPSSTDDAVAGEMPGESHEATETLPAKYNRDTELTAEIQSGSPTVADFNLE